MSGKKRLIGTWRERNLEKSRKYSREYNARRRQIPEVREQRNKHAREYRLAQFGLTVKDFDMMMEDQGGVCAICERPPTGRALNVDHEHQRQEKKRSPESRRVRVRGLLCHRCNRALGLLGNDPQKLLMIVENMAAYLEKYYAKRLVDIEGLEEAQRLMKNSISYLEEFEKRKPK